jgi:dTDP-4-dehydrorhamnose reductase
VIYTHHSTKAPTFKGDVREVWVDLSTGEGLRECCSAASPAVIVNCAAMSQPAACERDPDRAAAINIPSLLLAELERVGEQTTAGLQPPLLIHFSTDQVYDGSRAGWREQDACEPVNVYGRTKLEAEREIQVCITV